MKPTFYASEGELSGSKTAGTRLGGLLNRTLVGAQLLNLNDQ